METPDLFTVLSPFANVMKLNQWKDMSLLSCLDCHRKFINTGSKVVNRLNSQPGNRIKGNSFTTTIAPVQSVESSRDLRVVWLYSEVNFFAVLKIPH